MISTVVVAILLTIFIVSDAIPTSQHQRKGANYTRPQTKPEFGFAPLPTVSFRAAALATIFAADKKTFLLVANSNCPSAQVFKPQHIIVVGPMPRYGPRYLCTYKNSLFVAIAENKISGYTCTSFSSKTGCVRQSFWWSVWYKWNSELTSFGIDEDDIRLNRKVTLSAKRYANLVRKFWNVFHDGKLPVETQVVHSLHGHRMPTRYLRLPAVSKGGGAFGAPIWHQKEDPCVADTLDILYRWKNIIPRPCEPIVYDGSGFYVDPSNLLSSTALADCNHDCGFRYYYGSKTKGQIIAYRTKTLKLKSQVSVEGAILDHA